MNYYLDCEFLEGTQKEKFPISLFRKNTKPTIDLISIGLVSEDGREYYAISKDFNLNEAWNRFQVEEQTPFEKHHGFSGKKVYWLRENVLKPIFKELEKKYCLEEFKKLSDYKRQFEIVGFLKFNYSNFKMLVKKYGKTNKQIAEEIKDFCLNSRNKFINNDTELVKDLPEFYGYYADYDWVVFCWLFGKMIDLPTGFPMYTKDLKQILDEKAIKELDYTCWTTKEQVLEHMKTRISFPKQENAHNALDDARFNKKLHEFLKSI
jgi:hypothetical protein